MDDRRHKDPVGSNVRGVQPVYLAMASSADGVNIFELFSTLWAGRWWIISVAAFLVAVAIPYSLALTPIYRAEVVLAPVASQTSSSRLSSFGGLASLAGINLNLGGDDERSIAILRSREFIAEFIRGNNLLPVLFADEWDAEGQQWLEEDPELHRDLRDGVEVFVEDVRSISEDAATGLVTLAVEWTDPETAARWATELVERINEGLRSRDITESQKKLEYLSRQLENANLVELRQAISRVMEEQINSMMLAQAQSEYAFTVIDPAIVPKQRVRPRRTVIVIVAAFLGGFLGALVVLGRFAVTRVSQEGSAASA